MEITFPFRPSMRQGLAFMMRLGAYIFPISASGKTPLAMSGDAFGQPGMGGFRLSTNDPRIVRHYWFGEALPDNIPIQGRKLLALWKHEDDANAGVNLQQSGWFVLDADDLRSLSRLCADFGPLPDTLVVRSTRVGGGKHYYFKASEGAVMRKQLPNYPNIDIKHRGYVLIPGSCKRDADGKPLKWYEIESPPPIAEAPQWLMDLAVKPHSEVASFDGVYNACSDWGDPDLLEDAEVAIMTAGEGSRNDTLNKFAFLVGQDIARGRMFKDRAIAVLVDAARRVGLADHEAAMTIRSGILSGMRAVPFKSEDA